MISVGRFSNEDDYYALVDDKMKLLDATSTRNSLMFVWTFIQKDLYSGLDFNAGPYPADEVIGEIYKDGNDIELLAVISPGMKNNFHNPLTNPDKWKSFVQSTALRYPDIKYYQLSNEIQDWLGLSDSSLNTAAGYAIVANATIEALLAVNPNAKLVIVSEFSNNPIEVSEVAEMLKECEKLEVPIYAIDIHHWSLDGVDSWKMGNLVDFRTLLDELGYEDTIIWSAEHAAYTGLPAEDQNLPQGQKALVRISEKEQARWLIKSFTYNRANGLDRVMWTHLVDNYGFHTIDNLFNGMGLISDGYEIGSGSFDAARLGTERIAFFAYKMLAEKTEVDKAKLVGTVAGLHDGEEIFAYEFLRQSDSTPFYILWSEAGDRDVELPTTIRFAHVTNMITDRFGNYSEAYDLSSASGQLSVTASIDPLLIEKGVKPTVGFLILLLN